MGSVTIERRSLTVGDVRRACIPERFWKTSAGRLPENLPYTAKVQKYIDIMPEMLERGVGLYLWSTENGTGKTSIATIIAKEALRCGKTVLFTEVGKLRAQMMSKELFEDGVSLEGRIDTVDVLVLDDIGKEYKAASGYTETTLENIVRSRVQRVKTTILTGNVEPAELQKMYSADFAALLKESTIALHVAGFDFRSAVEKKLSTLL